MPRIGRRIVRHLKQQRGERMVANPRGPIEVCQQGPPFRWGAGPAGTTAAVSLSYGRSFVQDWRPPKLHLVAAPLKSLGSASNQRPGGALKGVSNGRAWKTTSGRTL